MTRWETEGAQCTDGYQGSLYHLFCQKWHKYRLTMNRTEVQQHVKESGQDNILITVKVIGELYSKLL